MPFRNKHPLLKYSLLTLVYGLLFFVLLEMLAKKTFINKYSVNQFDSDKETVVVIGDSFAAIGGSFPFVLAKHFKGKVNILNISENGFGPEHYLMNVKLAQKIEPSPQFVILSIFVGNDILNLDEDYHTNRREKIKMFLGSRFFSYHMLRWAWVNVKYTKRKKELLKESKETNILNPLLSRRSAANPDIVIDNLLVDKGIYQGKWKLFADFTKQFINFSRRHNNPLAIVIIPEHIQVSDRYQKLYIDTGYNMIPATDQLTGPQDRIKTLLTQMNVPYLDMLPILKTHDQYDLYYDNDPHLTHKGQNLLAQEILAQGWWE